MPFRFFHLRFFNASAVVRVVALLLVSFLCLTSENVLYGDSIAAKELVLSGYTAHTEGPALQNRKGCFRYWSSTESHVSWDILLEIDSMIDVSIIAAVDATYSGSRYQVQIGSKTIDGTIGDTGGWETYERINLGKLFLTEGSHTVKILPTMIPKGAFANVKSLRLTGVGLSYPGRTKPLKTNATVDVFSTSMNGCDQIEQIASLESMETLSDDSVTIAIDPAVKYQTIVGFGGAFTESAGIVFSKLDKEHQQEFLDAYFDSEKGNRYRLCRTHINSCDFSKGNYAYTKTEGDTELKDFSIERDNEYLIPLINAAKKVAGSADIKLLASPWSPPAWMKTNNQMTEGGKLRPEYREAWAKYYCKYIEAYRDIDIDIWGLTVQNEPDAVQRWESCIYSAEEERDFVRDYLGPALHSNGHQEVKLIVWDHNRDQLFDRAKTIFDDAEASKYVWGAGFHWYVSDEYHHAKMVNEFYPDKKLLFTEGCLEGTHNNGQWNTGEHYARSIINDLNSGAVGWIDWNILLNSEGGPNHVGNFCSAPIIAGPDYKELIYNNSYHYIGHFSRYIDPGARRILCGNTGNELLVTAFINPDDSVVLVVLNENDHPLRYALSMGDFKTEALISERSISTLVINRKEVKLALKSNSLIE